MNRYLVSIFFLISIGHSCFSAPFENGHFGDCPDGSPNGATIERGRFFYECRNGAILPKGCMSDDLKHLDIGQTSDKKLYRIKCVLNGEILSMEPSACLQFGNEHKIDEQWEDQTNFYTCKKEGTALRTINLGCLDQGKRVQMNEKIIKDDFVMVCNETVNNGARMMQVGCVKEGRQYNVGDSFEIGKFWFNCTRIGREKVAIKTSGCLNNGKRLNDGDRFFVNDVIYECTIDSNKNDVRTIGCAQRDEKGEVVERRLGCTWVEGPEPFQYEWACQHDTTTNSAKKVQVRCNYKVSGGGVYNIEPGCFRTIDKTAVGCLQENARLKLQSFQGDKAVEAAMGAGLHVC